MEQRASLADGRLIVQAADGSVGNMADLLREIELQITGIKTSAGKQNVGFIREIGDGVAKVEGLEDVMLNEMVDLGQGITGLALDLDETEVGVIILGLHTTQGGGRSTFYGETLTGPGRHGPFGTRRKHTWWAGRWQRTCEE